MLLAVAVALVGFGVPLAFTVAGRDRDQALLELSSEAASAAVAVPGSFARDNDLPELPDLAHEIDLALYDTDGARLTGEGPSRADPIVTDVLDTGAARQDTHSLTVAIPITEEELVVGAIRAHYPTATVAARTQRTWLAMGALAVGVFAITALLAIHRSRGLAAPLQRLRDDAERLGDGSIDPPRSPSGIDEIDTVHTALADAGTRVDDALARERALSADLAHQLRTPLASLRLRLENEQIVTGHDTVLVDDALRDIDRLEATITELIQLARDITPTNEPHPLATVIRETAEPWSTRISEHGRALRVDLEAELPWITQRPQAIRQILDILIENAITHGAGTVTITAERRNAGATITIADEGRDVLDADQIFQRHSGTGSGIGLALARRLADAEGLRLVLADPGPGARFLLVLGGSQATEGVS